MARAHGSTSSNRKLAVLDLDNTLCDFAFLQHCPNPNADAGRPFLNYFLTMIYEHFDIIIWSATDYDCIQEKLKTLGISRSRQYKITQCLCHSDMPVIESSFGSVQVKSLEVIWTKYPAFDRTNTIIIDDQFLNFFQTPNNGLQIKPYFHCMYHTDNELALLGSYLQKLAIHCPDFSQENHKNWKTYKPTKK